MDNKGAIYLFVVGVIVTAGYLIFVDSTGSNKTFSQAASSTNKNTQVVSNSKIEERLAEEPQVNLVATGDTLSTDNTNPSLQENSKPNDDGSVPFSEILRHSNQLKGDKVFPDEYELDIETTNLLKNAISDLDEEELELNVFSAECYSNLLQCRVHYTANDSLVLYLMAKFKGMKSIKDSRTEDGDTILLIQYKTPDK